MHGALGDYAIGKAVEALPPDDLPLERGSRALLGGYGEDSPEALPRKYVIQILAVYSHDAADQSARSLAGGASRAGGDLDDPRNYRYTFGIPLAAERPPTKTSPRISPPPGWPNPSNPRLLPPLGPTWSTR